MMRIPQSLRDHAMSTHALLAKQQARVASLRAHLQTLEQDLATSHASEHTACESLAQSECAQLCNRVTTLLPRELRDTIYTHLLPTTPTRITREYFCSTLDPLTNLHGYDSLRWKAAHHPEHYWSSSYVTPTFLHELTQTFYRTSVFVFSDDAGLITQFLVTNHMGLGFLPQELVSKIELHLSAVSYDQSSFKGYVFGATTKPKQLRAALEGVEGLREGASVVVRFDTRAKDGKEREEQVLMGMSVLGRRLREVSGEGYKVRLVIDGKTEVGLAQEFGD